MRFAADEDITRWVSAFHEAGHAVIHCAAGGRIKRAVLTDDDNGYVIPVEEEPHPGRLMDWLAMILGGHEAAARFLVKHAGYGLSHARATTQPGARSDLAGFRRYARGSGISEAAARRETEKRVRRHWSRIERAAKKLHARGRLTQV
ncbi:hypothetical protein [Saccharomonospora azurea]|uniref:Peptidase family M41 n=1 Tax=Saccharomonospora azurea NA-128 TaxID=882081 RepID=H8GEU8_9PSEU|nr:hypothetical protein [Saccharomonospora azurea]EHY90009.1 hypothetical protein SacazDRAFT_03128 [Saccharomonospora azurea NA-128]